MSLNPPDRRPPSLLSHCNKLLHQSGLGSFFSVPAPDPSDRQEQVISEGLYTKYPEWDEPHNLQESRWALHSLIQTVLCTEKHKHREKHKHIRCASLTPRMVCASFTTPTVLQARESPKNRLLCLSLTSCLRHPYDCLWLWWEASWQLVLGSGLFLLTRR